MLFISEPCYQEFVAGLHQTLEWSWGPCPLAEANVSLPDANQVSCAQFLLWENQLSLASRGWNSLWAEGSGSHDDRWTECGLLTRRWTKIDLRLFVCSYLRKPAAQKKKAVWSSRPNQSVYSPGETCARVLATSPLSSSPHIVLLVLFCLKSLSAASCLSV